MFGKGLADALIIAKTFKDGKPERMCVVHKEKNNKTRVFELHRQELADILTQVDMKTGVLGSIHYVLNPLGFACVYYTNKRAKQIFLRLLKPYEVILEGQKHVS